MSKNVVQAGGSRTNRLLSERARIAEREKLRQSYKPRRVRLLFIAESPPSSGGFFYNGKTTGRDYLFAETMRALRLWPDNKEMKKDVDKRNLLRHFQSIECFLLDMSLTEVDKLEEHEKERRLQDGMLRLIDEVAALNPERIVIVKKNVFELVEPELEKLGLAKRVLNKKFLPFPSHGNQLKYRKELRQLLDKVKYDRFRIVSDCSDVSSWR